MNARTPALLLLAGLLLAAGEGGSAAPFVEVDDAGQLPSSAQDVALVGAVESVEGRIEHAFDADLYRLVIAEPIVFSATVMLDGTDAPDPQLFLFDEWGRGVVANDNWLFSPLPQIPAATLSGQSPGLYLLAVAPADDDPRGVFGEIFPDLDQGISVPTGKSRLAPLLDWSRDFTAAGGDYLIALSGARGVVPPLEADFDEDGDVDGDDLTRWQAGYGHGGTHLEGDADADADVDGADYLTWQRQHGWEVPLTTARSAVPEPAAAGVTLLGALALSILRRPYRALLSNQ